MVDKDLCNLLDNSGIKYLILSDIFSGKNDVDLLVYDLSDFLINSLLDKIDLSNEWHLVNIKETLSNGYNLTLFNVGRNRLIRIDIYKRLTLSTFLTYPSIYFIPYSLKQGEFVIDANINLNCEQLLALYRALRGLIKNKSNVNIDILTELARMDVQCKKLWEASIEELENNIPGPRVIRHLLRKKGWYNKIYPWTHLRNKALNMLKYRIAPHIAIIGPDGCGKSTVIEALMEDLKYSYGSCAYIHLRPTVIPASRQVKTRLNQKKSSIPNPHQYAPYSSVKSALKFIVLYLDYSLGYIRLMMKRIRGVPVVSDRYFYDLLVDPKRFRLKQISKLKRAFVYVLPRPQKTIFLKVTPEEVFRRKKDLTLIEIERQMIEYSNLQSSFNEIFTVNANESPEMVYTQVKNIVFGG